MSGACWFHVDMDAFYAAIEQRDDERLRGRPVIVGGSGPRAVVAACSYEARAFGIHSAMPAAEALRRCPHAVAVPVAMDRYVAESRRIQAIFREMAPIVQPISIDEAFLDLSGTERLLGPPVPVARALKARVARETGLTISVGIGTSRFIAKLASKVDKPDGLYRVAPGDESEFVAGLSLRALWGLGASTRSRLERLGVTSVNELRAKPIEWLRGHFGAASAEFLFSACRGIDPGGWSERGSRHSISTERTFDTDIADAEELRSLILEMADEVMMRSIHEQWRGRTVTVKYRFPPFETHTVSRTLPAPPESAAALTAVATALLRERRGGRPLRLVGIGIAGDVDATPDGQRDLFADDEAPPIDATITRLRDRFGRAAIGRASSLERRTRRSDRSD